MRRVLVTGATGCIGRFVVPKLVERGWEVWAMQSSNRPVEVAGVHWLQADLLAPGHVRRVIDESSPDHLLHLAWYLAPGKWAAAPANFAWVRASLELAAAFKEGGGKRLVSAGSCLEYDWNYGYCSEDRTPCTPQTVYGVCKHSLQLLTSAFADASQMTSAWGRIFFLYGPHEHPDRLVASVIRAILAGQPARTSHGNQIRDYLYADDVADALVSLLESDATGPINIGSGQGVTLRSIVEMIGRIMARPDLIHLGAIPAAPTDKPVVIADTTRLSAALNWMPRWDLERGLRASVDFWRGQPLPTA